MDNIKSLFKIVGRINYILSPEQKRRAVKVFFSMIVCSLLELLGVSVIYPFLQLMMNEETVRSKWYINWMFKLFPNLSFNGVLIAMCVGIIIVYLVKNITTLVCIYIQNQFGTSFQRELSTEMLAAFMKRPYEFFVNTNTAKIMQSVGANVSSTYIVLLNLFQLITDGLTVLMISVYLIYTDWFIAVAAIMLAFFCFLVIVFAFKKRLKQAGKDVTKANINSSQAYIQAIHGIKEISVMDRREFFVDSYKEAACETERVSLLYNFLLSCPDRILEGVCIGGFLMIACIRIIMGVNLTEFIPELGAFAVGAFKLLPSMSKMSNRINSIVFEQNRLEMCSQDISVNRSFEEAQKQFVISEEDHCKNVDKLGFNDAIEIRNIHWKYANTENNVIEDLSLTINKGEAIALIGSSGAGKTTLADIILGLFRPQQGSVYMDGIDVFKIPHVWAENVGYVPQSVYLIDDTIRANVAFGLRMDQISDESIWKALEEAQLADYVRGLPEGIDTMVGERGVRFSGGQRQRIAIARALYGNPQILILDEATSALDTETETAVMESIESLLGHKTLVIIAHRLSTIRKCDRVYEIVNGKAVERDKSSVLSIN